MSLRERFKELTCMFRISTLMEQPETGLLELLEKTVHLIPPALQFPAIAEARIVVEGRAVQTGPFWKPMGTGSGYPGKRQPAAVWRYGTGRSGRRLRRTVYPGRM